MTKRQGKHAAPPKQQGAQTSVKQAAKQPAKPGAKPQAKQAGKSPAKTQVKAQAAPKQPRSTAPQYAPQFDMGKKPKKSRKRSAIVAGVVFGVLLVAYLAGVFVFSGRFFPNTTVSHLDISFKTPEQVSEILDDAVGEYEFTVTGQGLALKLKATDLGMVLDSGAITDGMMKDVNAWMWPVEVFMTHDETESMAATYGSDKLVSAIKPAVDELNASAIFPTDATIGFDEATNRFAVVSEVYGTALDAELVAKQISEGTKALSPHVTIDKSSCIQPKILKGDQRLAAAVEQANVMIKADLDIKIDGNLVTEVTPALVSTWVTVSPDVEVAFDDDAFSAWIDEVSAGCNTIGAERTYTRADGKEVTVSGGVYGWEIDSAALRSLVTDAVKQGTVGAVDIPVTHSGNGYSGLGDKDWGPRYCDIDLSEQHAYFYGDDGALIWESPIVTGSPGAHATPPGVWQATWGKQSPSKLIGEIDPETEEPEYETVVQYWMPFVGNAIGLHDATWQPAFGGTRYRDGFGSHGCVNLPLDNAAALYDIIQPGDVVVVHW